MIVALHGFLGTPDDWDFLRHAGFDVHAVDLFDAGVAGDFDALEELLRSIASAGDTLLGYSMGGRLALQMLARGIEVKNAVIVSAGLNIDDASERAARVGRDDAWARRFEKGDWTALMNDWNAQPVFGGARRARGEGAFDRPMLARALRGWSPGSLPPLAGELSSIEVPVLWVAGAEDAQYTAVARRATSLLPNAELSICPDAGHRVPWEQPDAFVARLREFPA